MADRNQQFDACRNAVDVFVRQVITIRTEIAEKEAPAIAAVAKTAELASTPEQREAVARHLKVTAITFGLHAMKVEMQLDGALRRMDLAASGFTGSSGRYLRRHIQRARDQVEAIKADCQRIRESLAAL